MSLLYLKYTEKVSGISTTHICSVGDINAYEDPTQPPDRDSRGLTLPDWAAKAQLGDVWETENVKWEILPAVSGLFSIPISVFGYPGIHYPDIRWNGWAVPYFTLDTCRKIIEDTNGPSFEDEMDGVGTLVQDGETYYSLGAYSWCWQSEEI